MLTHCMNLPGFDHIEKIGESSRTTIWKARQTSLDRTVCVRVLKPEFSVEHHEVSAFVEPSRAAARVKHPNMIQIYDVAEHDGLYYLVMEYIGGMSIAQMLQNGPFPQRKALEIARQVAGALEHAWQVSHLIHRNLKPSVISIDEMGVAKIADISLATVTDPQSGLHMPGERTVEGTPHYMSPEQARGTGPLDFHADMYGLGATLYHMMTGHVPFSGMESMDVLEHHISGYLRNPREIEPSISVSTVKVLSRLMMKNPMDRYDTWGDAMRELERVASGGILISRSAVPATRPSTIAPEGGMPEEQDLSAEESSDPAPAPATRVSLWVSIPAWILLVLFWMVLLLYRLDIPLHVAVTRRFENAHTSKHEEAPPGNGASPAALVPDGPLPSPLTAEPALTDAEKASLSAAKDEVAQQLLNGRWSKAMERAEWESQQTLSAPARAKAQELRTFVAAVTQIDIEVINGFMKKIGQDADVMSGGKTVRVRLQAMSGDTVRGVLAGDTASPVIFTISSLDPLERSRWLGPADTPVKCAMKYLFYMQSGDFSSAMTFAQNSGPLSAAFQTAALAKTGNARP